MNKSEYWSAFKEYHKNDVWGRFLKWLKKINKRHKEFIKYSNGGKKWEK